MTPSQAIQNLQSAGMTEAAIAKHAGVDQSTVNRIKHGRDPGWALGQRLVDMALRKRRKSK
jgi:transcriptional regulator with XRE-family HTH domain